tara:strand:+ start:14871 stop:15119 length:249 start_codon:yes stop_codon:yes gene_type:complete
MADNMKLNKIVNALLREESWVFHKWIATNSMVRISIRNGYAGLKERIKIIQILRKSKQVELVGLDQLDDSLVLSIKKGKGLA